MSKRALLVGINGFSPLDRRSEVPALQGCVNDAWLMEKHLKEDFGFVAEQVRVLTNEDATGERIRGELDWLLRRHDDDGSDEYDDDGSDVRFFHISTHGTQVEVRDDPDERDGKDEAFVVYDHAWGEPFRDNEIRQLFAKVPKNVTVIFQADCCHSGDLMECVVFGMEELQDEEQPETAETSHPPRLGPAPWPRRLVEDYGSRSRRLINPELMVMGGGGKTGDFRIVKPRDAASQHVLISACEDIQESKEFRTEDGYYHGGLTWAVSETIKQFKEKSGGNLTGLTYRKLIEEVGNRLRFSQQTPQLEGPEYLLDTQVFSPVTKNQEQGGVPMNDPNTTVKSIREALAALAAKVDGLERQLSPVKDEPTEQKELIRFLIAYVSATHYGKVNVEQLMNACKFHSRLQGAMKTGNFNSVSQAYDDSTKPLGDEGGGGG